MQQLTAEEVERTLSEVLSGAEFAPVDPPLLQVALAAAWEWLVQTVGPVLRRLLPDLDLAGGAWEKIGVVAIWTGAALGVALIVYLLLRTVRAWRRRRRERTERRLPGPSGPMTAEDWERTAQRSAEAGRWREAAASLYQAVLYRLSAREIVHIDSTKTPGDYRREVRRTRAELAPGIDEFVRTFEALVYGRIPPGPEGFGRLSDAATELSRV